MSWNIFCMYFIEPSAEETVAGAVENENCSTGKQHKQPSADHLSPLVWWPQVLMHCNWVHLSKYCISVQIKFSNMEMVRKSWWSKLLVGRKGWESSLIGVLGSRLSLVHEQEVPASLTVGTRRWCRQQLVQRDVAEICGKLSWETPSPNYKVQQIMTIQNVREDSSKFGEDRAPCSSLSL